MRSAIRIISTGTDAKLGAADAKLDALGTGLDSDKRMIMFTIVMASHPTGAGLPGICN